MTWIWKHAALIFHHGLYRFIRILFVLKNVPGIFWLVVDVVPATFKWQSVLLELENIAIFLKTLEEHISHMKKGLTLLQNAEVSLKINKCRFFANTNDYIAEQIHLRALKTAFHATDEIEQMMKPHITTDLHSSLELCNVFSRCRTFSEEEHPLIIIFEEIKPK